MRLFGRPKQHPESTPETRYAECERATATPTSPFHVRELTDAGLRKGGGADTAALCGREVAWDTREITLVQVIEDSKKQWETWSFCPACIGRAKEIAGA